MLTIEALATGDWIQLVEVRASDGQHDVVDVIEHPRTAPRQVQMRAGVEDNPATGGIERMRIHARTRRVSPSFLPLS
jgi:hypothetical protein